MLRIPCPFCGPRDHAEFAYEGDASVTAPPLDAPEAEWFEAVFLRENPRGPAEELWQHLYGCRAHLIVERDTLTHEITGARLAHPAIRAALSGGEA
ncbi:MAG: sarcosine oxidase subunit delta [Thermohalobaculum sp.]|nr:sarcosine oxidase subunit delta [Thermohalobaculum sp.]